MDILAIEKDPIWNSREIWSRDMDFLEPLRYGEFVNKIICVKGVQGDKTEGKTSLAPSVATVKDKRE